MINDKSYHLTDYTVRSSANRVTMLAEMELADDSSDPSMSSGSLIVQQATRGPAFPFVPLNHFNKIFSSI